MCTKSSKSSDIQKLSSYQQYYTLYLFLYLYQAKNNKIIHKDGLNYTHEIRRENKTILEKEINMLNRGYMIEI